MPLLMARSFVRENFTGRGNFLRRRDAAQSPRNTGDEFKNWNDDAHVLVAIQRSFTE